MTEDFNADNYIIEDVEIDDTELNFRDLEENLPVAVSPSNFYNRILVGQAPNSNPSHFVLYTRGSGENEHTLYFTRRSDALAFSRFDNEEEKMRFLQNLDFQQLSATFRSEALVSFLAHTHSLSDLRRLTPEELQNLREVFLSL